MKSRIMAVAIALSALAGGVEAGVVKEDKLPGEKEVRDRVKLYLEDTDTKVVEKRDKKLQDIELVAGQKVFLTGNQITFKLKDEKTPEKLTWACETRTALAGEAADNVKKEVKELLGEILGQYHPDKTLNLLTDAQYPLVMAVVSIEPRVLSKSPEEKKPEEKKPEEKPGTVPPYTITPNPYPPTAYPVVVYRPSCGCCGWTPYYSYQFAPAFTPGLVSAQSGQAIYAGGSAVSPRTRTELVRSEQSTATLRQTGRQLYHDRNYSQANEYLEAAIERDDADLLAWKFLALTRLALGKEKEAAEAARQAAARETLAPPDRAEMGLALERVQGAPRAFLRETPGGLLTSSEATQIVARYRETHQPVTTLAAKKPK